MNIVNGWFSEKSDFIPGHCLCLKIKNIILEKKTKYQDLLLFESTNHGKVLVLDGMIQLTERDEYIYHEMMSMLPLMSHPGNPRNVLIIGGGDGGVAREVLKDNRIDQITICELDEDVINISKQYLPVTGSSLENSKVKIKICDGLEYMKDHSNEFDVIITDSTDPIGPANTLFEDSYFQSVYKALKSDGVMCSQGEGMWLENNIASSLVKKCKRIFPVVRYATGYIPTYPLGQIGFILCGKDKDTNFEYPRSELGPIQSQMKYYSTKIHSASLVLPHAFSQVLNQ